MIYPLSNLSSFCSALSANSKILKRPKVKVDLPDPVLPITPIFSFLFTLNDIPLRTKGKPSRYLYLISLTCNTPCYGHSLGFLGLK